MRVSFQQELLLVLGPRVVGRGKGRRGRRKERREEGGGRGRSCATGLVSQTPVSREESERGRGKQVRVRFWDERSVTIGIIWYLTGTFGII